MFLPGFIAGVLISRTIKKVITREPMYASKNIFVKEINYSSKLH